MLRVGWESNIDSLNPFVGQSTEAYSIYHLNYDFLVRYDAATLSPSPDWPRAGRIPPTARPGPSSCVTT